MTPAGQGAERRRHDGIGRCPGRGDAARDKGRGVEFVVGEQHQAAAEDFGAASIQAPGRGEPR